MATVIFVTVSFPLALYFAAAPLFLLESITEKTSATDFSAQHNGTAWVAMPRPRSAYGKK